MNPVKTKIDKAVHFKVPEYLSPDILEEEYVKIFAPYRILQGIMGSCRVDVRNRFVTAPSFTQKCYTIVCFVYIIFATVKVLRNFENRSFTDHQMIFFWIGGLSVLILVFIINMAHTRFVSNDSNVKLIITIQEIDRVMKLSHSSINTVHFKRNMRATVALGVAVLTLTLGSILFTRDSYEFYELIGPAWALSTFVFELSCCSSYIALFDIRVRLINTVIINHFKLTVDHLSKQFKSCSKFEDTASKWSDFESSDIDVYMKHILDAYLIFQQQYRLQVTANN